MVSKDVHLPIKVCNNKMHAKMFKASNRVAVLICAYFFIGTRAQYSDNSTYTVLGNYEKLLESGNFSDVCLVVGKEKKEFRLHKNILFAQCPMIGAMFDAKESFESQVIIPDESPEVFVQFIHFLYTGNVTKVEYCRDLVIMADKYRIDGLKSRCTDFLRSKLTLKSVASTLVFADRYNATSLKAGCIAMITNRAEDVMASEGWKQVMNRTDLVLQLYADRVKTYNRELVCPEKINWG